MSVFHKKWTEVKQYLSPLVKNKNERTVRDEAKKKTLLRHNLDFLVSLSQKQTLFNLKVNVKPKKIEMVTGGKEWA